MGTLPPAIRYDRWLTVTMVIAIHIAAGYGLSQTARQVVTPAVSAQPLLVELLAPRPMAPQRAPDPPPAPPQQVEPVVPEKPVITKKPEPVRQHRKRPQPVRKAAPKSQPVIRETPPTPIDEAPAPAAVSAPAPILEQRQAASSTASETAAAPPATHSPVNYNADYLRNPAPAYPAISRRMGQTGRVLLHVFVNGDGQPEKVEIKKSSGYQRLDQSALDAVRNWRFVPARDGGHAIASWVMIPIIFKLQG